MAFVGFKGYDLQVNLLLISSIRDKELRDYILFNPYFFWTFTTGQGAPLPTAGCFINLDRLFDVSPQDFSQFDQRDQFETSQSRLQST